MAAGSQQRHSFPLRPLSLFLPLLLLLLLLFAPAAYSDDAAVMSKFLAGISPAPSGWSDTADYCDWKTVRCDSSKRVTSINLAHQSLTGSLPSTLNSLSQLVTLSLQSNHFMGELPSLANLSHLREAYLDNNNFTSIATGAFAGLTSLQSLSLSNNYQLSPWHFPEDLKDSTSLTNLYAVSVNLTGTIPDVFDSFSLLQNLSLSFNNLSGGLPPSFAGSEIQLLWLNNQAAKLTGPIDLLATMNQLTQAWLHNNAFSGPIPDLSNLTSIYDLQLRDNRLTGIVPSSLMDLTSLQNVTLQNNKLQGPYPAFKAASVKAADLGTMNSFCLGEDKAGVPCDPQVTILLQVAAAMRYPITLAESWTGNDACNNHWPFVNCDSTRNVVTSVNLAKKRFGGSISPAYANLTNLQNLYLSDNNLTGTIPESLTSLPNLKKLDLSNNNLSGEPPKFRSGISVITSGNPNIGSDVVDPTTGSGGSSSASNSTAPDGSKSSSSTAKTGVVAGLVIAVLLFVGVLLFVSYRCFFMKRRMVVAKFGRVQNPENGIKLMTNHNNNNNNNNNNVTAYSGLPSDLQSQSSGDHSEFQQPFFEGGNVVISIQVLRQVTNNFSQDNILGRGGFGIVYKGELHDGTKVAVKRMESSAMGTKGLKEFQAEIAVLTKVRHRHLVALLGYCINGNERLLVYEYMPQGTLGQHLFEWEQLGCLPLTWKQRVTIALDVARGVEYLHSLARSSFIHRDLKPSNILLGDDMRAKVADFGLVKNAPDGKHSMETRLAGTFGYLAPEYAATGRVTTKVDVYAFGVILMEILAGRKALDETMPEDRCHLVTWFRRVLIAKDNIRKSIDSILNPDEEEYQSILKVAELAGHCTAREPQQRPDMGHAVNVLGPLVEQWKPSSQDEDNYGIDLHMSLPQALQRWQANEGTSTMLDDLSFNRTQGSIPAKPSGFSDTFNSTDCR